MAAFDPSCAHPYFCLLTFAFFLFPFALPVLGQDDPPPPPPRNIAQQKDDDIETIRIDTELVDLNVSVFSRDSQHPVGELQQTDFAVSENGAPEEISSFASASTPFDLVLLMDLSGSTVDKLDLVRKSAIRFVEAARPTDRIGIITFTDMPFVVSSLTSDRNLLIERIKKIEKPRGGTNFWDAVGFVLNSIYRTRDPSRRQALIVMSDGVDNALPDVPGPGSNTTFEMLLEGVKSSDAILIPIYLDTEREMIKQHRATEGSYALARQQLVQLAGESGSMLYRARKLEDLRGVYEQVIRDLGTVYSIGYRPTNRNRDGSWRNVSVRLVSRPDLAARTRRGYYAK
ncbi:MAG: Ca-activated chloride channel [Acidobacteriota bacterium]|jgi:VWFA-related protein|nr:Ca-activated chloride channel [Acidobacteriota bacterium]